jgi:hypothetical protein
MISTSEKGANKVVKFKIKDLLALSLSLWLCCGLMPIFANASDGGNSEKISDSVITTNTTQGTVDVHKSLNDESRFYIAPLFKFLAVNVKGDMARRGATIKDKTEVFMKLQFFTVPALRREVARELKVKKIWKVRNLPVNAIRVNLKSDSLGKKYGVEKAYKIDHPAYAQDLDVVFSVASDKANEFIRDINRGNVDFRLIYAFNQVNIDSYDTQKIIKASDNLKGLSVTVKPTLTSGMKHLDLRPESQTAKGLVAYYPFDGNANDYSGNKYHGIVKGSATLTKDQFGNSNSAYHFDGNSKIVVNSLNKFPEKDDKFAVSVWFKRTGGWDHYQGIVNNGYYDNGSWEIRMGHENEGTKLGGGIATEKSPDQWDYMDSYASQNEWHHVVMSYDRTSLSFYLDGVAQSPRNINEKDTGNIIVKNTPLTIGQAGIGVEDNYFFGVIDEVRIYNRPLPSSEIQNLYQSKNF